MKNFLILMFLFFLSPVFAGYTPIPSELSYQYKIDIENFAKNRIYYYQQKIDNILLEYSDETNTYIKQIYFEQGINSVLLEFYLQLVEITNKYVNIKESISHTDYPGLLYEELQPYFKDNRVNMKNINFLSKYAIKKQKNFIR